MYGLYLVLGCVMLFTVLYSVAAVVYRIRAAYRAEMRRHKEGAHQGREEEEGSGAGARAGRRVGQAEVYALGLDGNTTKDLTRLLGDLGEGLHRLRCPRGSCVMGEGFAPLVCHGCVMGEGFAPLVCHG